MRTRPEKKHQTLIEANHPEFGAGKNLLHGHIHPARTPQNCLLRRSQALEYSLKQVLRVFRKSSFSGRTFTRGGLRSPLSIEPHKSGHS